MHLQASRSSASAKSSVILAALVAALLFPGPAWGKRVVLTKFTGPKAAKAQKAVAAVIKRDHTVIPTSRLNKAKKRLKIKKLNPRNIQRLAEELNVDAIVSGKVKKKGSKYELTITVREGKTGDTIDKYVVKLREPKVDETAKAEIAENLLNIIAAAETMGGDSEEVASAGPTKGKKGKKGADEEEGGDEGGDDEGGDDSAGGDEETPDEPEEKKVAMAGEGEGGEGGEKPEAEASADTVATPEDEERFARDAAADVSLGVSFIGRNMAFTYDSAVTSMPWGYRGNPVPGAYVIGEVYPLAFGGGKGALAGLGIGFNFDRIITLRSRLMSGGEEYDTTQTRWGVGALYRWNIGDKVTNPSLTFGLGYNGLSFVIASGATPIDLPNAQYSFVDLGAGVRFPLGSPRMAVNLDLKYLQILNTGDMQKMENYGGGSVTGFDADANFEFRPVTRLVVRVGGRYTRIGYAFDGTGTKTNRDADADKDVGGALDQYFGGYVLGGYLF
jgi:hypothetical protein